MTTSLAGSVGYGVLKSWIDQLTQTRRCQYLSKYSYIRLSIMREGRPVVIVYVQVFLMKSYYQDISFHIHHIHDWDMQFLMANTLSLCS